MEAAKPLPLGEVAPEGGRSGYGEAEAELHSLS